MTKESRAVAIAALTLFMFALYGFLKDGSVIFPFPLNEFIFLVVSFQFLIWHYKRGWLPVLFVISGIAGVLGTQFLWEIIYPARELEIFMGYSIVDWARLISKVFLFATALHFVKAHKQWYYKAFFVIGVLIQGYGVVMNDLNFLVIGLLIVLLSNSIKPVLQPFQWIWTLAFILEGSKWLTMFIMNH